MNSNGSTDQPCLRYIYNRLLKIDTGQLLAGTEIVTLLLGLNPVS